MKALEYKPSAFWRLDGTSPFTDFSGYSRTATQAGTQVKGIALTADAGYSQNVGNSNSITFNSNVYQNAGNNTFPFTLSITVYPSTAATASDQQIMSKTGQTDGLFINGTVVSFRTKYATPGDATCSYDIGTRKKIDVVGVHTPTKNSLYVNGILVDEVDITAEQQGDVYVTASNNNLVCGTSSSGQKALVNNAAIYSKALRGNEVFEIYNSNRRTATGDIAKSFGGETFVLSTKTRIPSLEVQFRNDEDWMTGVFFGCSADGGELVADLMGGYTSGGTWSNSINLGADGAPVTYNTVYFDWEGENETLQYSLDDIVWTDLVKGVPLSGSVANLFIRVTFTPGLDSAYVSYIKMFAYESGTTTNNARTITYTQPLDMRNEYEPSELHDNWGVKLNGGSLTIQANDDLDPTWIELWIKQGTGTALTKTFTPNATWVNGVSTTTIPVGEWSLVHFRVATAYTSNITLGGDVQIGRVSLYNVDQAPTISNLYKSYVGVPKFTATQANAFTLSEPAESALVYAEDWQINAT